MTGNWRIRSETQDDAAAIAAVTALAFRDHPHSDGSEPAIIARLRASGALAVSLVADDGAVIGHIAFSAVSISDGAAGWYGLGPVSVHPARQRQGVGAALVEAGLEQLRAAGGAGCALLGDPAYYHRFGFVSDPALDYPGAPPDHFQHLVFFGARPSGLVSYHPAFG